MANFKEIRIESKRHWYQKTKRKRYINDLTTDAFECQWQINLVDSSKHNSFFCSLGEWNTHISDFLLDCSFDKFEYVVPRYNKSLFRHYTRFFLIVSEILTDFQDLLIYLTNDSMADVRYLLSKPAHSFSFQNFMDYVNHICKHKGGQRRAFKKYHCLNHHIEYKFLDNGLPSSTGDITINNLLTAPVSTHQMIEVPKLLDIIDQILFCYDVTDGILNRMTAVMATKMSIYEKNI